MSNVRACISELKEILDKTPSTHNIMLVGNHGIGKSEILTAYFSNLGMPVVALFLGQMSDPGDLIGLPHKDEKTGKTDFMPPYWFPVDGKPIVLFLDELNRARPEILQTVMDLCLNRKLAGRELPEGSRVIAAVNEGDQYQLTDLDPALVSRFNIIKFLPTTQEWLLWANKEGLDNRVIDFIQENSVWLDKTPDAKEGADTGLEKTPDRRAWKRVSDVIKGQDELTSIYSKLISSIIGTKAAAAFLSGLANRMLVTGKEVLYDFNKHFNAISGYKLHELSIINDGIFRTLEVDGVAAKNIQKVSANLESYCDFLLKDRRDAAGHFTNLFTSQNYPKTVAFIVGQCGKLPISLYKFVSEL